MRELHDFFRSSSAHRVRIALAFKGLDWRAVPVQLQQGEQLEADYRALNPQGLVPVYSEGELILSQSLAIIEYLDETHPTPPLLPSDPVARARARQFAQIITTDVQPLTGLRVMGYLRDEFKVDAVARRRWLAHWLMEGFDALELWLAAQERPGRYCVGDQPSVADLCLVPALEVARRSGVDIEDFPRLAVIEETCMRLPAFQQARPAAPAAKG